MLTRYCQTCSQGFQTFDPDFKQCVPCRSAGLELPGIEKRLAQCLRCGRTVTTRKAIVKTCYGCQIQKAEEAGPKPLRECTACHQNVPSRRLDKFFKCPDCLGKNVSHSHTCKKCFQAFTHPQKKKNLCPNCSKK